MLRRTYTITPFLALLGSALPHGLPAQHRLIPTPVLDLARLSPEPKLDGFVALRGTLSGDSGVFSIQRARITAQARPVSFVGLRLQADFSAVGRVVGDSVPAAVLTDAYAQFEPVGLGAGTIRPALLVGQFKVPFSLEYLSSFAYLQTANRSRAVDRLAPRRDIGVTGHVRLAQYATFAGTIVNGSGANRPNNPDKKEMVVARLTVSPTQQVAVAGKWLRHGNDRRWGGDVRIVMPQLIAEGEWIEQSIDQTSSPGVEARGGYLLASYRLRPWLQPVLKWEFFRHDQIQGVDRTRTTARARTLGVNFLTPGERERVRLQLNWVARSEQTLDVKDEFIIQFVVNY